MKTPLEKLDLSNYKKENKTGTIFINGIKGKN